MGNKLAHFDPRKNGLVFLSAHLIVCISYVFLSSSFFLLKMKSLSPITIGIKQLPDIPNHINTVWCRCMRSDNTCQSCARLRGGYLGWLARLAAIRYAVGQTQQTSAGTRDRAVPQLTPISPDTYQRGHWPVTDNDLWRTAWSLVGWSPTTVWLTGTWCPEQAAPVVRYSPSLFLSLVKMKKKNIILSTESKYII